MLLLLALWACDPALTTFAPAQPPPPVPTLTAPVYGLPATVAVQLPLGPGVSVAFVSGVPGAGPCPAALRGACLSVVAPTQLGRTTTDASGVARLTFPVTAPVSHALGVQAVVFAPGGLRLTGRQSALVLGPADDPDRDGLSNAAEIANGADPLRRDSDNGGVDDGQEVVIDHTDPAVPADDVDHETWCERGFDDDHDGRADCADADCDPICGESCFDGRDNDLNGLADCADPVCAGQPDCVESCFDGRDNDLNGLADCADPVCAGQPDCVEDCYNRWDDNRNGLADCEDPACPACIEVCDNGLDDDLDRLKDCFDADCGCVEVCDDGADNDEDGLADCQDDDCPCAEDCGNGQDDDRDLRADCLDDDCLCVEACEDGVDGDGDGLSGCADPDCTCGEVCGNGVDDDADGLADCEDAGCTDLCVEDCADGADNDGDLWTDCQDEECWSTAGCEPDEVLAWVRAGTLRTEVAISHEVGSSCAYNGHGEHFAGTAEDVAGRVRVERDGRALSCDWRVDRVDMLVSHAAWNVPVPGAPWQCTVNRTDADRVTRTGFRVDPACGLANSDFLPQHLKGAVTRPHSGYRYPTWNFDGGAVAKLADGRTWYRGDNGLGLYQIQRGYGWGDTMERSSARSQPLGPTVAYGVCETGAPGLVTDPAAGVRAECVP